MPDLTLAVSEATFATTIDLLKRNFVISTSDSVEFGRFAAKYYLSAHLEGGTTDIRPDGSVQLSELDLRWDHLRFSLAMAIDTVCVGGGCITFPWPGGTICLPTVCAFEDDFDAEIEIDLAPFVSQEVSLEANLTVRHWDPSAPPPALDVCAPLRDILVNTEIMKPFPTDRKEWHIHLTPGPVDIDLFDFPDIAGNLFEDTLTDAITALVPLGFGRDWILAIIGDIAELIRTILDIPDEIEEWLSDIFNISFGLHDLLIQVVGLYFGSCIPLYRIDDPFTILKREGGLIPVKVPIRNLAVSANDDELIITADVGAL